MNGPTLYKLFGQLRTQVVARPNAPHKTVALWIDYWCKIFRHACWESGSDASKELTGEQFDEIRNLYREYLSIMPITQTQVDIVYTIGQGFPKTESRKIDPDKCPLEAAKMLANMHGWTLLQVNTVGTDGRKRSYDMKTVK